MLQKPRKGPLIGGIIAGLLSLTLLIGAGFALLNRQALADQLTVWSFEPSAAVQSINDRLQLTEKGQFYFYASQPEVAPAETFNEDCPRQEPGSPILGCYTLNRIFIYDIQNERLDGIEEVTAAHEMLHAAWDRLPQAEQSRLETLLLQAYEENQTPELLERISYYERNQPDDIVNELHSILPTEVRSIGSELEQYYAQYFEDRAAVVTLFETYNSVFLSILDRLDSLLTELEQLDATIEQRRANYEAAVANLSRDIDSFNARASNGGFSSQQQFNTERSVLVQRTNSLEQEQIAITNLINRYNTLYEEYTDLGAELQQLNESIDSIQELEAAPELE